MAAIALGVSEVEFHNTVLPLAKLEPLIVSGNAAAPTTALAGFKERTVGALPIVKLRLFDVTPFESTVTPTVPAVVSRLAGIDTVICAGAIDVGVSAVELN